MPLISLQALMLFDQKREIPINLGKLVSQLAV